jgi:hypothetical protein
MVPYRYLRLVLLENHEKSSANIQGDQNFYVHLMITIHNFTSYVLSVRHQSSDIY